MTEFLNVTELGKTFPDTFKLVDFNKIILEENDYIKVIRNNERFWLNIDTILPNDTFICSLRNDLLLNQNLKDHDKIHITKDNIIDVLKPEIRAIESSEIDKLFRVMNAHFRRGFNNLLLTPDIENIPTFYYIYLYRHNIKVD